jgi:hypothetical protein
MAMTEEELKNQLFKLSAQAIYHLSDGSTDPISIQEAIEHNSYFRPILYCVQILSIKNIGDSEKEITFVLSPDYLMENRGLVIKGLLNEIMWTFKLNNYDYGIEETIVDDAEGRIDIRSEEGVENWIARGEIKILQCNKQTYQISLVDFFNSIVRTESD